MTKQLNNCLLFLHTQNSYAPFPPRPPFPFFIKRKGDVLSATHFSFLFFHRVMHKVVIVRKKNAYKEENAKRIFVSSV